MVGILRMSLGYHGRQLLGRISLKALLRFCCWLSSSASRHHPDCRLYRGGTMDDRFRFYCHWPWRSLGWVVECCWRRLVLHDREVSAPVSAIAPHGLRQVDGAEEQHHQLGHHWCPQVLYPQAPHSSSWMPSSVGLNLFGAGFALQCFGRRDSCCRCSSSSCTPRISPRSLCARLLSLLVYRMSLSSREGREGEFTASSSSCWC